jgi:trans-aconitate 2-methyltransferase
VVGTDLSEDMLAAARKRLRAVTFRRSDIASWQPETPVDLVFANASLQWVPDHETVFARLLKALAPGGTLAVQMPDNLDEPTHRLMREIAADGPWAERMTDLGSGRAPGHDAVWYYGLLGSNGAHTIEVWRTTYFHPLSGPAGIVEFVKGAGLRPFLARLLPEETGPFLDLYRAAVAEAYPPLAGGTILLPFPRLFIVATR